MSTLTLNLNSVVQLTDDQFLRLCAHNPDVQLERTATGELIIMPPTGGETGKRSSDLNAELNLWNRRTQLGVTFDSSTGFVLPNGAIRSPDAAWIPHHRWDELTPDQRQRFLPLCPDFAVELLSPSDRWQDGYAKLQEYQANGTRLGWLIDPQQRRVGIFREGGTIEVLDNPEQLSGEAVLPEFMVSLSLLWAA
ncbi:hypothetical protein XM38_043430 [Halomicronema hongdechloris C2206]|uniref:Putative restriction endonuclease domain-containing protein n=1 Tax=Halomicronema hongdechloris C2206 TaxID=1641165 RepID=A0A1Z3HSV1_9CYAN|nr:Uma2 family endonuclease [Halomicronema hongdechloris]ASC73378.1 hypothetical protein XM38_043430 [Halomicronema hongdechloris C2206]